MEAIILHKAGQRIWNLQKGLGYENIKTHSKIWEPSKELGPEIFDTNILILGCDSPDYGIIYIIPELRTKKYLFPIVVIDESKNEETKKLADSLGADTYFAKPFLFRNLAIELKNLVYKKENLMNHKWLRAYNIWLDMENRLVKRDKHTIPLRNKEFALLEFFIINRGKVLSRNAIMEHVWDRNANFASNTVDVHINRLRKKLDDPFREKLIHTIPCIGYSFEKRNGDGNG